ncbi:Telomere repeat-binding factor 3 [Acorus calamus]|uniref:Telomere repeat-binding factor 3 n=1 Tax=Acorus calamus TaxID=4465 RepID=A0AAV9DK80_ACOCL|nr:Telomere repeat-binding factor 3 [Acorus calamus]
MGPAFLEVAASEALKGKEWSGALAEPDNAGLDSRTEVGRGASSASVGIDNGVVPDRDKDASDKVRGVIMRETSKAMKCGNIALEKKYDLVLSPEVEKAKEALKSSVVNLQEAVKDPLPDAELVAAKVMTGMVEQPIREDERTVNEDEGGENQRLAGVGVGGSGMDKGGKAPVVEGDTGDRCSKDQYRVTKPSLMDRNPTAHTYEWDDSIESLSEQSPNQTKQICLPSPKRRRVSPLKLKEDTKITRRRKPRRWSTLEEETLRKAVREHGVGNWKFILKCHLDIFEERTEVDLKDKWRNMTRS